MDGQKLKAYYDFAISLVMKCGPILREGYIKAQAAYNIKSAYYDLVTEYDKIIEDMLIDELRLEFPESEFIGEEEASESKRKLVLTDAPTWIIDPIDGTTNFIHRIPHCCISLGLAVGQELVVGVVHNPIKHELYSAWKGHGAFLNGHPIRVTDCKEINEAVVGYEISLIHAPAVRDKNVKRLCKLASYSSGTRCIGSAALTLCYVARGSLDCYHVEDLKPWDIAGGAVILREAGGLLCHTNGGTFNIMKPDLVCGSTEPLVKHVIKLIEEANQITEFTFK